MNIKSRVSLALLAVIAVSISGGTSIGAQTSAPAGTTEAHSQLLKRIHAQKLSQIYVKMITSNVRQSWEQCKVPSLKQAVSTTTVTTIDASGRIADFKITSSSRFKQMDDAVTKVVHSLKPIPLIGALPSLKLFWTFMSDGTDNILDHTDSKEANLYDRTVLGVVQNSPLGVLDDIAPAPTVTRKSPIAAPHMVTGK